MTTTSPTPTRSSPAYAQRGSAYFDVLVAGMAVVIVLSNIGASKGVQFGPVVTDGGFFLFPLAYILGDVISEVYGFRAARRATLVGFAASALAVFSFWVIIALPGFTDDYGLAKQEALEVALGPVWQIVVASMAGFVAGQLSNAWVMSRMKARSQEKGLVARLMGSTGVGEAIDTILFCTIAATAIGITTLGQWASYVFFGFLWKTLVEFALVPLTRVVIGRLKQREPSYQAALLQS
ncbi:queuosine precursor transporter [Propionibacteriaceae bacterium Y1923]|uniref:queuosine precursor transporter n=1 Tax=Aestuariimicrobium sp. Y1814 TaxID=3418742 RepID=UPI003C1471EA